MVEIEKQIQCFVCTFEFNQKLIDLFNEFSVYEQHLLKHNVVVPKFENIEQFSSFLQKSTSLAEIQSNGRCFSLPFQRFDQTIQYFIIDKEFLDDLTIKNIVEKNFLQKILDQLQMERNDKTFSRSCLFCKKVFTENRALLFNHLYYDHNFYVGHHDNIFGSNELLDILESKLKDLYCLYCEKQFKCWRALKEHMRKKGHKLINPNNRIYDKFYLINYLSSDKHWQQLKNENDVYVNNFNDEWCDWIDDENDKMDCLCFFCPYKNKFNNAKAHLLEVHRFDFTKIYKINDFYDRIKMVNYIRKSLSEHKCFICQRQFRNADLILQHLEATEHISELPAKELFQFPEYYYPTFDNDCFLLFLDEFDN